MSQKHTNALIHETSPYLLQHAHNPVNWEAWDPQILDRASQENKLILISIGYAACHWCHVMEKECFEDEEVAQVMNRHYISIKIDREERPDIDHIYMDALQMMTGSGGWPLNVVALPDGRPFWGATYVKKNDWIRILEQLAQLYQKEPQKVLDYAQNLADGIRAINLVDPSPDESLLSISQLDKAVEEWSAYFDTFLGGYKRAPKFMMPTNLDFLLHYARVRDHKEIEEYVHTSLKKMAWGGLFDQLGGGFSRYSVDTKWHIPHFEKMLYDNGQLVSLYAMAYGASADPLYKNVVEETIEFVTRELMDSQGAFYSSLDADSMDQEGRLEEGSYYVWEKEDLERILHAHFDLFKAYYNINSYGHWEEGKYVLIRDATDEELAAKNNMSVEELQMVIRECKALLLEERNKRERPRLDDKILASWNGLMLKGLVDAYRYLGNANYLELALQNAAFINRAFIAEDGSMFHNHKNNKSSIQGYLEDYASVIEAFLTLYEVTFDETHLFRAKELMEYCLKEFHDPKSNLFFFTGQKDHFIIRRTLETTDNVIPASNSIMAKNLFRLSRYFIDERYEDRARQMVSNIKENLEKQAQSHSNWLHLVLYFNKPFYEIAFVGEDANKKAKELYANFIPNAVLLGTKQKSELAVLQNRYVENKTYIYVCEHGSCKLPVTKVKQAMEQLLER